MPNNNNIVKSIIAIALISIPTFRSLYQETKKIRYNVIRNIHSKRCSRINKNKVIHSLARFLERILVNSFMFLLYDVHS